MKVGGARFLKINIMPVTRRVQRVHRHPLRLPKDPLDQQCPAEGVSSADERSVRARGSSACAYYDVANCSAIINRTKKEVWPLYLCGLHGSTSAHYSRATWGDAGPSREKSTEKYS